MNSRNFRIIGQGKNLLKTLNTYVEIDSVEEIDEVPQIEKINPQMTIDFKIIKKDKEIYHNNLILSYVQFLPSIKPSILRRNDGTYAFMIGFTFPIFPFNSINWKINCLKLTLI